MVGKRHDTDEISAKLGRANELLAQGKTQREISKAIGVSVMTYHRWRKAFQSDQTVNVISAGGDHMAKSVDGSGETPANKIKRLEFENAQLRRLVTDMLLEQLSYGTGPGKGRKSRPAEK
ncbi:helix-turn-helix domain-containing protein [Bradyrhizobium sp. 930_D9_N1_4]|uniref:helix-turn-helix domain-containing protein n=1 Tax=Bradyrhizobium sp. 930_D9_N1_4 TaxID=3240374 RepID=UPI003F88AEC2